VVNNINAGGAPPARPSTQSTLRWAVELWLEYRRNLSAGTTTNAATTTTPAAINLTQVRTTEATTPQQASAGEQATTSTSLLRPSTSTAPPKPPRGKRVEFKRRKGREVKTDNQLSIALPYLDGYPANDRPQQPDTETAEEAV